MATKSTTPRVIQVSCWRAKLVSPARSSRWITASPSPLSAATTGQQHRVGVRRGEPDRDVRGDHEGGQPSAVPEQVGGHLALDADADGGVGADADGQGQHEQEQLRAAPAPVHEAHQGRCSGTSQPPLPARVEAGAHLAGEVLDGTTGRARSIGVDAVPDLARVEVGEPVQARRWWSRRAGTARPRAARCSTPRKMTTWCRPARPRSTGPGSTTRRAPATIQTTPDDDGQPRAAGAARRSASAGRGA